ncbi:MAG: ELWxxDGT repeat protein, partial [Planctomycetota bacterium]
DGVWLICKDGRLTVQKQLRLLDPNTLELSDFSLPFYYPDVLVVHDDHFAVVDRHQVMVSDGSSTGTTTWELGDIDGHTVFHDGLLVANGVHGVGTTLYLVPFDGAPMETVVELDDDYVPRLTFDGELAFFGNTLPDRSTEAWVTDGTAAGTRLLRKLDGGDLLGGSSAGEFTVFLDRVVFSAATGTHGREAWITDGTAAGTELLIETNPNSGGSYPENWMQLGGETYFFAKDGTARYTKELWKTDGTASGTQRTGAELRGDFDEEDIRIHNDIAYLMSHSSFWITDGTPDGTRQVGHDVDDFGTSAHIFLGDDLITAGAAYDNADRHLRLFSYDVNQDTVTPINLNQEISVSRVEFFEFENDLYIFNQTDSLELWKFDTASQEVSQVKQIRSGPMVSNPVYDFVTDIVTVGDAFYFVADNGETGAEVWRSDGTPDGTALLRDLYEGEISSYPRYLTEFQGELFFQGCGAEHGTELWRSDGTAEGTRLVIDIQPGSRGSHPGQLTVYGDELLFAADDGASGFELWKSDGTAEGTERVEDIRPGEEGAHPWLFTLFQDKLYFLADDGRSGREFWHYDSETQQVALGAETIVGPEFAWPSQIFATDQAMFFRGNSPTYGREPWVYRGDQLWFESSFPADVDGNEVVSPLDALTVITELTLREFSSVVDGAIRVNITPTGRADVNNDGFISPLDALLVINQLPSTAASALGHPTSDPIVYFTQQHIDDVWAQDEEEHADLFE